MGHLIFCGGQIMLLDIYYSYIKQNLMLAFLTLLWLASLALLLLLFLFLFVWQ